MSTAKQYCSYILPKVSRTFAINIAYLKPSEIYDCVLVGYLICRAIDTIEDAENLDITKQISLLENLKLILKEEKTEFLEDWMKSCSNISHYPDENNLMMNFDKVFSVYQGLKSEEKKALITPIEAMIDGMISFLKKYQYISPMVLKDMKETELYCYYVAGTVGEFLTNLFRLYGEEGAPLDAYKIDFGVALQLTNILKDFMLDYHTRAISYISDEILNQEGLSIEDFVSAKSPEKTKAVIQKLIGITKEKLDHALTYSLALKNQKIRIFCLLPLFFALATLKQLSSNSFEAEYRNKISKREVFSISFRLKWLYKKDVAIKNYYESLWNN